MGIKIYITYFIYTETLWLAKANSQILITDKSIILGFNKGERASFGEWGID